MPVILKQSDEALQVGWICDAVGRRFESARLHLLYREAALMNAWKIAAGTSDRPYSEIFHKFDVMLIGPGDPGKYPHSRYNQKEFEKISLYMTIFVGNTEII